MPSSERHKPALERSAAARRRPEIRIGISGWLYPSWRTIFYPEGLPPRQELGYASRSLNSIEINGTFYSLRRPADFRSWHAATPPGFLFAVKGGRFITHVKRLNEVEIPLANFFASGVLALADKLGPILWQLPPNLRFDEARLEGFCALLPGDTMAAAALARRHDARLRGRSLAETDARRPMRHAIEARHASFRSPRFVALLRRYGIALVVADAADRPRLEDVTADFVYVRLHGAKEVYASGYADAALDDWALRVAAWTAGRQLPDARLAAPDAPPRRVRRDAHVYFDNDANARAPFDALALARKLKIRWVHPKSGSIEDPGTRVRRRT